MESVDYCEGTIMYHSSGGGTGSGLGGLIAEKLMMAYSKKSNLHKDIMTIDSLPFATSKVCRPY